MTEITNTYHHGDLRAAVIEIALAEIETTGFEALSLRKLAKKLGVSHQAPYKHFPNKEALLADLATVGYQMLERKTRASSSRVSDGQKKLVSAGKAYVHFVTSHPQLSAVMFGNRNRLQQFPHLMQAASEALGALREIIQSGQDQHTLVEADADLMTMVAWATVHGLALIKVSGGAGETQVERVVDLLIQGLGT